MHTSVHCCRGHAALRLTAGTIVSRGRVCWDDVEGRGSGLLGVTVGEGGAAGGESGWREG